MNRNSIPNILTISRVVAIIPIAVIFAISYAPSAHLCVLAIFIYACITDYVDGALSRRWNCVSSLGRLLDPVADKLLVAVVLVMLIPAGINAVAVAAIIVRELFVSGLREFMQERGAIIHVSGLAKWKTAMQMLACGAFLLAGALPMVTWINELAAVLLWIATFLTLWTGAEYAYGATRQLKSNG